MKNSRIILLLLLCLIPLLLRASFALHNPEKLNNMLSNNAILCMHQDAYGFMWLGTYDGLNLYDGSRVSTFRYEQDNPNSLSGNNIHNIQSFDKEFLWVATQEGLDKFSIRERRVVESYPQYKKIDLITTDSKRNMTWLVAKDSCIDFYELSGKRFCELPYAARKRDIRSFFSDEEGRLCVVRSDGRLHFLSMYRNDSGDRNYNLSIQERTIHERSIRQVFYEDGNIYFIDDANKLYFYDYRRQHKMFLRDLSALIAQYSQVSSLVFFQNDIFIAFIYSGLIKLNMSGGSDDIEAINLTIGAFGLCKDRFQDALWVGTDGRGVQLYYSEKDKFSNILLENLPFTARRPVRSFYTDEERSLWIGTKGDGIFRIKDYERFGDSKIPHANIQRIMMYSGFYESPVFSFVRSRYNPDDLWLASDDGVFYYSYKKQAIFQLEASDESNKIVKPHSLCEINDSTLWVSANGLCRVLVDKTRHPYRIKSKQSLGIEKDGALLEDEYYAMIYDGRSKLFLGSRRGYGVLQVDVHSGKYGFISMDNARKKGIGDIISLFLDGDSILYVGSGSGMTQIKMSADGSNEIKQFGRHNGIINDMIHGILKDDKGVIWLSTNKGLVKYNPANESFLNVKSPQIAVSEYSDDAYWFCPLTHRLFFGGVNGLVWIEPQNGNSETYFKPELMFTELNCFGKLQTLYEYNSDPDKILRLESNQNTFRISFAVLDYIHGDNYDYSYRLDNYDTNWNSLQKESEIQVTKLPPGTYTLRVKYKSDVLYADENVYSLKIEVLPPWYLSLPARVAYFVLFLLLLFLLYRQLRNRLERKHRLMARRIKEEQKEKMYESKLRFFTNITHEFYTPLTLINGAVEQIRKEEHNEGVAKYLGILQNNVQSLTELVREILDYRKIEETGHRPLELKNVDLNRLLHNLLASFAALALQNRIEFVCDMQEHLNWYTDSTSFKKIVSNLTSNALKYTPVGGKVSIRIFLEGGKLHLDLQNSGRGIPAEDIDKIFNRYRILEDTNVNANNQMTARHGLGLNICHSLVKLLEGEIRVESEEGHFTRFTVVLPNLLQASSSPDEEEHPLPASIPPAEKEETSQQPAVESGFEYDGRRFILAVDDNPEIIELVNDILAAHYFVKGVYSASEALELLKIQSPDLIITDIMMPEMDGLSLVKQVREDKYHRQIPIIALTAKVEEKDQIEGYATGVDAYVTKPFSSEVLLSIVNRFLLNKDCVKEYYDSVASAFEYSQGKLMHQKDREFIEELTQVLDDNISNTKLGPDFVADKMKMSSRNLYRKMKQLLDIAPSNYIKEYKLFYASRLLINTDLSIKEVIYRVGITNKSYFYREFAEKYKMSPKNYKEAHRKCEEA